MSSETSESAQNPEILLGPKLTPSEAKFLYHLWRVTRRRGLAAPKDILESVEKYRAAEPDNVLKDSMIVPMASRLQHRSWKENAPTYVISEGGYRIEGEHYIDQDITARIVMMLLDQLAHGEPGHEGQILLSKCQVEFRHELKVRESTILKSFTWLTKLEYLLPFPQFDGYFRLGPRVARELEYISRVAASFSPQTSDPTPDPDPPVEPAPRLPQPEPATPTAELRGMLKVIYTYPCHRYHLTLDDRGNQVWIYTLIDFRKSPPGQKLATSAPVLLQADADREMNTYDFEAVPYGNHLMIQSHRSDGTSDMCVDLYPHANTQKRPFCGARINDSWSGTTVASSISLLTISLPLKEFEDVQEGPIDEHRATILTAIWEQKNEVVRLPPDWPTLPHLRQARLAGRDPRDLFKVGAPYYHYHLTLDTERNAVWIGKIIKFQVDKNEQLFAETTILPYIGADRSENRYKVTPRFIGRHLVLQLTLLGSGGDDDVTIQLYPDAEKTQFPHLYCATINRSQTKTFVSSIAILSTEPLGGEIEGPVDKENAAKLLAAWEGHAKPGRPEIVRLPFARGESPSDRSRDEPAPPKSPDQPPGKAFKYDAYSKEGVLWHGTEKAIAFRVETLLKLLEALSGSEERSNRQEDLFIEAGRTAGRDFAVQFGSQIYPAELRRDGPSFTNLPKAQRLALWSEYDSSTGWGLIKAHEQPNGIQITVSHPTLFDGRGGALFAHFLAGYCETVINEITDSFPSSYHVSSTVAIQGRTASFSLKLDSPRAEAASTA